jgi:hypothetical protein
MFISVINISSTFDSTIVLIYNLLFMFIIYFLDKNKIKSANINNIFSVHVCGKFRLIAYLFVHLFY